MDNVKRTFKWIAICLLSFMGAYGLTCSMSTETYFTGDESLEGYGRIGGLLERFYRSMSSNLIVLSILVIVLACVMIWVGKKHFSGKEKGLAALFALAFSIMQILGKAYETNGNWNALYSSNFLVIRSLLFLIGYLILSYCAALGAFYALDRVKPSGIEREAGFGSKWSLRTWFLIIAVFLFICWLPYLIVFAPGTSNVDTSAQIAQFFGIRTWALKRSAVQADDILITNHFPFLTTLYYGGLIKIGLWLGNAAYGVLLNSILQMSMMALELSGIWLYLHYVGLSKKFTGAGIIFTAFFPCFPMYAICMIKDVIFAIFCLALTVLLCEVARTGGEILHKKWFCVMIAISSALVMLTRSQGVYIMIVVALAFLIVFRKFWKQIALCLVLPVLLFQGLWINILLPMWNVAPASEEEALGFLFQQTARYVTYYPEDVTDEERAEIKGVLKYKQLPKVYNPVLSDKVKRCYKVDSTSEQRAAYFKAWWSMFLKHPGCYVQATLNNCYQFFMLEKSNTGLYTYYNNDEYWEEGDELYVEPLTFTDKISGITSEVSTMLTHIPVIGILFGSGFYVWLILFFCLYEIRVREYRHLLTALIAVLSVGILVIAPANGNMRYVYPLVMIAPFLTGLMLARPTKSINCAEYYV